VNKPELLLLDPTFCKPPLGGPTANQESQKERRTSHFHRNFGSLKSNAGGPIFALTLKDGCFFKELFFGEKLSLSFLNFRSNEEYVQYFI
jgi:hypothetical protein